MYKEWADSQVHKIKDIMYTARAGHADAVKARIEDVKPLSNVVDITKQLFEVSKVCQELKATRKDAESSQETAKLEAEAFELEQKTALASEAKTVLDSWVRYEGQVKARQQKELADTIIAKINKELENPKVLQQILQQSVTDVESMWCQNVPACCCTVLIVWQGWCLQRLNNCCIDLLYGVYILSLRTSSPKERIKQIHFLALHLSYISAFVFLCSYSYVSMTWSIRQNLMAS